MPKLSKAVADAKKAIDTHDDITFVVHMKGPIFLDEQGYLSGYIKDVRNYAFKGALSATVPSEMVADNHLIGKRVSAGATKGMSARWHIAKALLGFYEGRNVNSSLTDVERAEVEAKYYKFCSPDENGKQAKFIQPPEGFEWTCRISAYTRVKKDQNGKEVLDEHGNKIVFNNYAFDKVWLNPVSDYESE